MSYETHTKVHSFMVTTHQTILANDIQTIIWETSNKIEGIQLIRKRYKPIGLKDAKELWETVDGEQR